MTIGVCELLDRFLAGARRYVHDGLLVHNEESGYVVDCIERFLIKAIRDALGSDLVLNKNL